MNHWIDEFVTEVLGADILILAARNFPTKVNSLQAGMFYGLLATPESDISRSRFFSARYFCGGYNHDEQNVLKSILGLT